MTTPKPTAAPDQPTTFLDLALRVSLFVLAVFGVAWLAEVL